MGTSKDVDSKLDAIRFKVESKSISVRDHIHLRVTLLAELPAPEPDAALPASDRVNQVVKRLNGLVLHDDLPSEVLAALRAELDLTQSNFEEALVANKKFEQALDEKDLEIARLRGLLGSLGADLGIE